MNRLILLFALYLIGVPLALDKGLSAAEPTTAEESSAVDCIWVKLKNGTSCCVELSSNPSISFEGETLVIGSNSLQLADVVNYRFGNSSEVGVSQIYADSNNFIFTSDRKLIVDIRHRVNNIMLCNANGVVYPVQVTEMSDGTAIIDLSDLPCDVYILSADGKNLKFVVR